jgi:hypothetical protein
MYRRDCGDSHQLKQARQMGYPAGGRADVEQRFEEFTSSCASLVEHIGRRRRPGASVRPTGLSADSDVPGARVRVRT